MALVYDFRTAMKELYLQREQKISSTLDPLVELLYSHSPINFDDIMFYMDMENDEEANATKKPRTTSTRRVADEDASRRIQHKVKTFEIANDLGEYTFNKEPIVAVKQPSALAGLLSKAPVVSPQAQGNQNNIIVTVFLPSTGFVKIKVTEKSTVEYVIESVLKQYELESKDDINKTPMITNPKCYVLRFADDDGQPDDDMPAFEKTREMGQFKGVTTFALVKDPKYKEIMAEEVAAIRTKTFRVYLPQEAGFVSVVYKDSMTTNELMQTVCTRRALNADQWVFQHMESSVAVVPDNTTLGELAEKEGLRLVEKKKVNTSLQRKKSQLVIPKLEEGDAPRQITKLLGPMFFFTPTTATRFKQFTVWKWNKFGLRKDRFLGVDAERITITGADKRSKSKTPMRLVKDVVKVGLIPNKPKNFTIEFKDKMYRYESDSAEEIVAKISYLLQMKI